MRPTLERPNSWHCGRSVKCILAFSRLRGGFCDRLGRGGGGGGM